MSKELEEELAEIDREVGDPEAGKKSVSFYIDKQVLVTFRGMLKNRRLMSRTVEALIKEYIRTRQASVLSIHPQKKEEREP